MSAVRLGIDTGGTFTDFVLVDEADGTVTTAKVPSTPERPGAAIRAGLGALGARHGSRAGRRRHHGRHQRGARAPRAARRVRHRTRASRTSPFIGRMDKERLYDLHWERPKPLVAAARLPRRRRPRSTATASASARAATPPRGRSRSGCASTRARMSSSPSACLFAYLTPATRRARARSSARRCRDVPISVSHEVSPVWREYERASTTIADAFVKPVDRALHRARRRRDRRAAWATGRGTLLSSNGGYVTRRRAPPRRPSQLVLSGLAGGVDAARATSPRVAGYAHAFSLDMGGTSTDIGADRRRRDAIRRTSSSSPSACRSPCRACGRDDRRRRRLDRRGSTAAACCMSARRAPAPSPARSPTAAAARSRR